MKLFQKHPVVFVLINMILFSISVFVISAGHFIFGSLRADLLALAVAWGLVLYVVRRELRDLMYFVLYGELYLEVQFMLNGIESKRTLTEKDDLRQFVTTLRKLGVQEMTFHALPEAHPGYRVFADHQENSNA